MGADDEGTGVPYRTLATDPALLSVFLLSGVASLGNRAIPVALPAIGQAFDLVESEIGLVMSAFYVVVLVALPVTGVASDVLGRRTVVIPSLLLLGVSGLATVWVTNYETLLVLRAVQGAAYAGTLPLTTTLIGDLYSGPAGSAAQGIRSGLNGLAAAIAPVLAGLAALVAWQYPFVFFALTIPVAGAVYRYYPRGAARTHSPGGSTDLLGGLWGYVRSLVAAADRRLALLVLGGFALFFLKSGFSTFLPVFVVAELGHPVTVAGTLLGVYGASRVVVSPLSGSVVLRLGRRYTLLAGATIASAGLALVPFSPNLLVVGIASGCFGLGEAMLNPVLNDAVAASAEDEQRAGIMSGFQGFKVIALTMAPLIVGAAISVAGFAIAFTLVAALGLAYGVILLFAPIGTRA